MGMVELSATYKGLRTMARLVDARRHDFSLVEASTPGESRSINWIVQERTGTDANGDPIFEDVTSFAPYSDWTFYAFKDLKLAGSSAEERAAAAVFTLTVGSGIAVGAVPTIVTTWADEQSANMPPGEKRGYEFWVKVNGEWSRIRYGYLPFVD